MQDFACPNFGPNEASLHQFLRGRSIVGVICGIDFASLAGRVRQNAAEKIRKDLVMLRESDNSMMAISSGNEMFLEITKRRAMGLPDFQSAPAETKSISESLTVAASTGALSTRSNDHLYSCSDAVAQGEGSAAKLDGSHWELLERGLRQRFAAVRACLDEIFCRQNIPSYLREFGFIEAQIKSLFGTVLNNSQPNAGWTWFGSTDVHLSSSGQLTVLDHNFSLPTGLDLLSSMIEARISELSSRPLLSLPAIENSTGVTVVLMPGFYSAAGRGNDFICRCLNAYPAKSADLSIRGDGVFVHAGAERLRVSTIVRRIDDDLLDPNCLRPDSLVGVPGLVRAWKNGLVNVLSPPGSCLANCRTFGKLIPRMIRELLGEEPLLESASVLECDDSAVLKHVMANLKDYAIRTNDPLHPARPFFGRNGMSVEFADLLTRLRKNPAAYVARPLLPEGSQLGLNLRLFANHGEDFHLIPAAIGRRCQPDGGASLSIGTGEEIIPVL
jgi:uncharacterized circularly permuted ATP-grasp superfamily protein